MARTIVTLPRYTSLTEPELDRIAEAVEESIGEERRRGPAASRLLTGAGVKGD